MRTLTGMGLQPASEPHLRGDVWVVRGIGREGTVVRVMLDSHSGRIMDMRAVNRVAPYDGPYGPGARPGPYQPDPRYVMRDAYPPEARGYPVPRPGQVYQDEPPYPGLRGTAAPDDEDDDYGYDPRAPQPRGYMPHSSMTSPMSPTVPPRVSSKPAAKSETRRVAAKPPLPKARPGNLDSGIKAEAAKKDDGKPDAAKQDVAKTDAGKPEASKPDAAKVEKTAGKEEPSKAEAEKPQASPPLTSPKDSETTASIAAANKKAEAEAKAAEVKAAKETKEQVKTDAK
jgi:hypothetical protein